MEDVVLVQCPYCHEQLELYIDPDTVGSMIQDCDVCCRPWQVHVARDDDGNLLASIDRAQ